MARLMSMPKLSDTMEEGAIAKWMKKVGDKIAEGDPLAEIETDKATMEYEAPETGYILKLVVDVGGRAKVGAPIAVIGDTKDEKYDLADLATASAPKSATPQPKTSSAPVAHLAAVPVASTASPAGRVKASPLAKKIAGDMGVDLSKLSGSGPGGRIVMRDLQSSGSGAAPAVAPMPAFQGRSGEDRTVRVTMMRQTIAKRLHAAKNDAPHFYLKRSVDMSAVNAWREKLNHNLDEKTVKVSVNDLIIVAVAHALRQHPMVNASWQGETIVQHGSVHVAMAVALPEGLVTPVIRFTDQLGARQIAAMTKNLAARARAGQLTNDDYSGGTFTISNLGMMGIDEFTAIINPPQAAILAVGATVKTPVVTEDDELEVRPMMKLTMSCDHRVVDGMVGAQFLQTLVSYLEDPAMMLS
jgi:pyruvate dehydrogenase E2 component (dihydrolipoamide acetyltransferase)